MNKYFMEIVRTLLIRIFFFSVSAGFLLFLSCKYPVDPEDRDIIELERIWQYCKAFSLYSERVPARERLLEFNDPSELVDSIYDTLHNWADIFYFVAEYYPSFKNFKIRRYIPYNTFDDSRAGESVYFKKLTDSTAYLSIKEFLYSTYNEFVSYGASVKNIPNLIINLRKNRGGYVNTCQAIIDNFLPENVSYLSVRERRISSDTGTVDTIWISSVTDTVWGEKNVVILIDENTASAAEILTAALRDGLPPGSVYLIGQKSFGKAIGQVVFHMLNEAGLMITTMRFLPISSANYHEIGINPDQSFTGPFSVNELLEAGKCLESGFENKVNMDTLNKIVSEFDTYQPSCILRGCYKIIEKNELPF